jgi:hypothetical protein
MESFYSIHSFMRWVIIVVALIALFRFLIVWIGRAQPGKPDRALMSTFVGLLDLQLLFGIILLVWLGTSRFRLEHGVTMLLAVIAGHLSAKWKNAPGPLRARNYFLIVIIALVLIYVGVARLPQGWSGGNFLH